MSDCRNVRWTSLAGWLRGGSPPSTPRKARPCLGVEALEERAVPSATPTLDLTTREAEGTINSALFRQTDAQPTGTGVINSFVRLQARGNAAVAQGYNTDARPLQFDENKSPVFTRSLKLGDLPRVNLGGVVYREFLLDINQKSSQPLVSLDELRLYVASVGNLASAYNAGDGTLDGQAPLYDLDAGSDNWVLLNARLNHGSGSGDMMLYVPDTSFTNAGGTADSYVYLYSKFGVNQSGNGGFEEWAAGKSVLTDNGGAISGTVFHDIDSSGTREAEYEPGLADWVVYIDANDSGTRDEGEVFTITNQDGYYEFGGLATGLGEASTYRIRLELQLGWFLTTVPPEDILLSYSGQVVSGIDFGVVMPPSNGS